MKCKTKRLWNNKGGFTLVELIVVLSILTILASVLVPSMLGWVNKAKEKEAELKLRAVAMAAESAFIEVYALYGGAEPLDVFYWDSDNTTDGDNREANALFAAEMEALVGSDVDWEDVNWVNRNSDGELTVTYTYKGVVYRYLRDTEGNITMGKADNPIPNA